MPLRVPLLMLALAIALAPSVTRAQSQQRPHTYQPTPPPPVTAPPSYDRPAKSFEYKAPDQRYEAPKFGYKRYGS